MQMNEQQNSFKMWFVLFASDVFLEDLLAGDTLFYSPDAPVWAATVKLSDSSCIPSSFIVICFWTSTLDCITKDISSTAVWLGSNKLM